MLPTSRSLRSSLPPRLRALVGVLGVLASALLALSCHLVVPYAASELDAAVAGSGRDGGSLTEDGGLEGADGWVLREGGGDGSASGSGCSRGVAERRVDDTMVVCQGVGKQSKLDECHAASLCNAERGWRLCPPLEYAQRFAARRPPVIGAWLSGCLYDFSALPAAYRQPGSCPHCGRGNLPDEIREITVAGPCSAKSGEDDVSTRDDRGVYRWRAKSVGLVSAATCAAAWVNGFRPQQTSAFWLAAAASDERAAAFCCFKTK
ncbi:MAG: hypothetical protein IPG96_09465 [Proteobacteria bacterium]|nr:hypothetical protein [Pseudomonadota bacterium]